MERAISTINQMPTSKSQIADFVEQFKAEVLSGYIKGEDLAIVLKSMEDTIKSIRADKEIKDFMQDSFDLYNERTVDYAGAQITKQNRPKYDFKECMSSRWLEASQNLMKAKSDLKTVEDWIKTLKEPTPDTLTGEMVNPPRVENTEVLMIKLPK